MKYNKSSRRMFLQGAGKTALAIPFLPSLLPEKAYAAVVLPKYIHINSSWALSRTHTQPLYFRPFPTYPQPAGTTPNSVPWTIIDADTKYQTLDAIIKFQGKLSWTLDEKWNRFASRMNLVTNAHAYVSDNRFNTSICSTGASGDGNLRTNNANGPTIGHAYSVDWLLEQAMYRGTGAPAIPTLRVHHYASPDFTFRNFCYGTLDGKEFIVPMLNGLAPLKAALTGALPSTNTPDNTAAIDRKLRVDSVIEEYKRLMNHRRISKVDKERLGAAAELWYKVDTTVPSAPKSCNLPSFNTGEKNSRLVHEAMMNAVVVALSCSITRNVAYGLTQGGDNIEEISNNPILSMSDPYYEHVRWRSNLVTYFLSLVESMKDENGQSMMDSTLTVWAHTTAHRNHDVLGHSLISVGNVGGKLQTGLHVDAGAAPVGRFHITNMKAMGLTQSDIEKSGRPGFGEYSRTLLSSGGGVGFYTKEKDEKTNDPDTREYTTDKKDHFFQDAEKRKAFFYLK